MTAEATLARVTPTRAADPGVWSLAVDRRACLGPPNGKHLSGGACTSTLIAALEAETAKPLIQASAQFTGAPPADATAQIETHVVQAGKSISLARATMRGPAGEACALLGSFGARPETGRFDWETPPLAPAPETCGRIPFVREDADDLHAQLDMRLALDERASPSGRLVFWVRAPGNFPEVASRFLALVADYVPEAIHFNIGRPAGAVSLDNTVRIVARTATPWLMCETRLSGINAGLFHGRMTIFTEAGEVLATASQSGVVRLFD
jgi:acyl-CoA thioesterase II